MLRLMYTLGAAVALFCCVPGVRGEGLQMGAETPQALATNCTIYVSGSGSANNSGRSAGSPVTLAKADEMAAPGAVVCLLAGTYSLTSTFYPVRSGTPSAWITYQNYGNGTVNIVWEAGAGASDRNMFHFFNSHFPNGPAYLEFRGLSLNGRNLASNGFFCQGSHHLRFVGNTIENMGSAGIGAMLCDYIQSDHNVVYHNGYNGGWSSGISYNSNQWYDRYPGFHSIASNNIVVGEYDSSSYHDDGNGIIMDLSSQSYNPASANTPPFLIVNNVIYGNGGRCIHTFIVTNVWVVNNTCYDNGLDMSEGGVGSIDSNDSSHEVFANNVVVTWDYMHPFIVQGTVGSAITFARNLIYGGVNRGIADQSVLAFRSAWPWFVNPPYFAPNKNGQYATALPPWRLGTGLHLQSRSPGINAGIDPTTLAGSNSAIRSGLAAYVYRDINGVARPKGGPFDLGAYEH
jgi:hypothetical protein